MTETPLSPRHPKAYVSTFLAPDTDQDMDWVGGLVGQLRQDGVDAWVDMPLPGQDTLYSAERGVEDSDFVLLICTPEYRQAFEQDKDKPGYIARLLAGRGFDEPRCIPLLRRGEAFDAIPAILQSLERVDFRGHDVAEDEYEALCDVLLGRIPEQVIVGPPRPKRRVSTPFRIKPKDHVSRKAMKELNERAIFHPPPAPHAGQVLHQRWKLVRKLDRGGFGEVWRGVELETQNTVAVKILRNNIAQDWSSVKRFFRGARAMTTLAHPHIVKVIDPGRVEDGHGYYVLEFMEGGHLGLRLDAPQSMVDTLRWMGQIGAAFEHAHRAGRIHRDVKPENILFTHPQDGIAKLTDFDLVFARNHTAVTQRSHAIGTMLYGAPEALEGKRVDFRADIYSLAMTGLRALLGREVTLTEKYHPNLVLDCLPVPPLTREVFRRALSLDPEPRPHSMEAFLEELEESWSNTAPSHPVDHPASGDGLEDLELADPSEPRHGPDVWTPSPEHDDTEDLETATSASHGEPSLPNHVPSTDGPPISSGVGRTSPSVALQDDDDAISRLDGEPTVTEVPPKGAHRMVLFALCAGLLVALTLGTLVPNLGSKPTSTHTFLVRVTVTGQRGVGIDNVPVKIHDREFRTNEYGQVTIDHPANPGSQLHVSLPSKPVWVKEDLVRTVKLGLNPQGEPKPVHLKFGRWGPRAQYARPPVPASEFRPRLQHILAGTFHMGSPPDEPGRNPDEPLHFVKLTRDFWLGESEVTQEQWTRLMGDNPSSFPGPDRPVENVSWYDALAYLNRLSQREQLRACYALNCQGTVGVNYKCTSVKHVDHCTGYRLPTEAEWEYAARAGTSTPLFSGALKLHPESNDSLSVSNVAWYGGNSQGQTHDVMHEKTKNPWDLYDMLGNVYEWTEDAYVENNLVDHQDPLHWAPHDITVRRGCGWGSRARSCRTARRIGGLPDSRANYIGFRIARNFPKKASLNSRAKGPATHSPIPDDIPNVNEHSYP